MATIWTGGVREAVGLALRLWPLSCPGYLPVLTEYDGGPYFGRAVPGHAGHAGGP